MNAAELKETLKALFQIGRPGAVTGATAGSVFGAVTQPKGQDSTKERVKRVLKYGLLGGAAGLPAGAAAGMGAGILGARSAIKSTTGVNWDRLNKLPKIMDTSSIAAGGAAGAGSAALAHRYTDEKRSGADMLRNLLGITKTGQYREFNGDIHEYAEAEGATHEELGSRGGKRTAALNRTSMKLKDGSRLPKPRFGDYSFDTVEPELARRAYVKNVLKKIIH